MINKILASILVFLSIGANAQELDYYFGDSTIFDENIPTPASILGYQVGEWHVNHDKLVQYMKLLAESSDRVQLEEYARTYENRPLLVLKISSPSNINNLETIKTDHLSPTNTGEDQPVIINLGYSVHGNEASGSNASILVAYYLAAAQGERISQWLEQAVILLDPSLNPDGLNRFAHWVNSRKSMNLVSDPNNYEQNEAWPGGRTNHYWFDLNRDWMPLQHPESQGRVRLFHEWRPHILTDHHEMGSNSSYFFQPGIPSRNNPLTPKGNYELTGEIAEFHAKALDNIGTLYYSEESFDDFYVGKGSTYPDINGSIGILFEQASARSHLQMTKNGLLSFPFAIRNHVTTSFSTLEASVALKKELINHQTKFYRDVTDLAKNDPKKAYVFGDTKDRSKLKAFVAILDQHQIETHRLRSNHGTFGTDNSYIVSLNQPQYRLIKSLFEQPTTFQDSLFYDVSAWTLPLAFDIPFRSLGQKAENLIGALITVKDFVQAPPAFAESNYAYAFEWHDYFAPALLFQLQQKGLYTKVTTAPLTLKTGETLDRGTIIIPVARQKLSPSQLHTHLTLASKRYNFKIHSIETGLTKGVNLGSPKIKAVTDPKPLLVVGKGVSSYESGEVWHLLDQRMQMPLPMATIDQINSMDLSPYHTLIMVNGSYAKLNKDKIKKWVMTGGTIIATKSANKWTESAGLSKAKLIKSTKDTTIVQRDYAHLTKYSGAQYIGGAIFNTSVDRTHPLCFGLEQNELAVFKNSTRVTKGNVNAYANPLRYTASPLLAGYVSDPNLDKIKNTAAVSTTTFGQGRVISFIDNPNFRAFWYGTNKLFLNALFFNKIIDSKSAR